MYLFICHLLYLYTIENYAIHGNVTHWSCGYSCRLPARRLQVYTLYLCRRGVSSGLLEIGTRSNSKEKQIKKMQMDGYSHINQFLLKKNKNKKKTCILFYLFLFFAIAAICCTSGWRLGKFWGDNFRTLLPKCQCNMNLAAM